MPIPPPTGRSAVRHALALLAALVPLACRTPGEWADQADEVAGRIITRAQEAGLGRTEPFTVETPALTLRRRLIEDQDIPSSNAASLGTAALAPIDHWPEDDRLAGGDRIDPTLPPADREPTKPLVLDLEDALQIAAYNSRDYQERKETVFRTALALDLTENAFRTQFAALLEGDLQSALSTDPVRSRQTGLIGTATAGATRLFQNGVALGTQIGLDVVKLLTPPRSRSLGLFADATISIPLLRGAGRHIVAEPLIQAERDTLYEVLAFERFKRTFAVDVASEYLEVLQQLDQVMNAEQNYRSLVASVRQLRRLADAGRRPPLEVDQAVQNELAARDRWIRAIQGHRRALDAFRLTLGLPPDAAVELERGELVRLGERVRERLGVLGRDHRRVDLPANVAADAPILLPAPGEGTPGPLEFAESTAVRLALAHRLDLILAEGRVYDAQRQVVVTADQLRAEVTLLGSAAFGERRATPGSAVLPDAEHLRTSDAFYEALLTIDLPLERTAERNAYRESWLDLHGVVRDLQELEDTVKVAVRDRLRTLLQAREGERIQAAAVALAEERVASARLFLDAGRAQTRDLLEAQEDLVEAQNDLTAALIAYRIAELELQRDMGLLLVGPDGLWEELDPAEIIDEPSP